MNSRRHPVQTSRGDRGARREIDYEHGAFFEWGIPRILGGALVKADIRHVF